MDDTTFDTNMLALRIAVNTIDAMQVARGLDARYFGPMNMGYDDNRVYAMDGWFMVLYQCEE